MRKSILSLLTHINNKGVHRKAIRGRHNWLPLVAALSVALCFSIQLSAQTYNLHWGGTSWAGPTFSRTISNIGGSGIDAVVTITNSGAGGNTSATGATADNNAFQHNTPAIGAAGGIAWHLPGTTGNNPLVQWVDWDNLTSNVRTVIRFSKPVNNVSFYLGDMDRTSPLTYVDRTTFTGKNGMVTVPNPMVTKYQATVGGVDTVLLNGNQAYGNATLANGNAGTSGAMMQGATIFLQYSNPIDELTILWDQGPGATGNPGTQAVVIGDIAFTKVIPLYPYPPTADNFVSNPLRQGAAATAITGLGAADIDGTIASYKILSVPTAAQGVLSIPCPATPTGATCTGGFADLTPAVLTANPGGIVLTPTQAAGLRFDPAATFSGNAPFTFNATDNDGYISNTATYILPVTPQPPISNNIMESSMANSNGPTAIQSLSCADVDGTIATYQLTSLPTVAQGVLSVPCPITFIGATCTGGYQDLTAAVLANYPSGIPLSATQMAAIRFDPTAGYTGTAGFTYNAVDNSGNTSNTANYSIPVAAIALISRPPLADNITAQSLNNSLSVTTIPALQASDLDGSVASYRVLTLPAGGVLYCCGGTAVVANQVLTPAQAATLQFDPAATYTGTASFTYSATDNAGLVSNIATYNLPVVNNPPTATNINTVIPFGITPTTIPALTGSDLDGTIASYTLATVPTAAQGTISVPCPPTPTGGTCSGGFVNLTPAVLAANPGGIVLTPAQAAGIRFTAGAGFSGTAPFTYTTTDNTGNVSVAASYNVTLPLQPPVTIDVVNALIANTAGITSITALNATDADGTIASYTLFAVPDPTQGVLSISCPATPAGATCTGGFADLTPAVLAANTSGISLTPAQAAALRFNPTAGYKGLVSLKFGAVDNSGLLSNVSTYTIPVSGSGNIPPVARNIVAASMPATNGATAITGLVGSDADGTIASYTLTSVPAASEGVLSIPCPATPTGATCTGGFADLTPAVLAANTGGIVLTTTQAAGMRFDPVATFSGNVDFAYITTDNSGSISAGALYIIPVTSISPVANAVKATAMSQTNGATAIPGLAATDADGTIASYTIETIPSASQGVLSCCGGTAVTAGQVLTPAQMATLQFDPASGHQGDVVFNYHATDNSSLLSNTATYTIPVTGLPPVSRDVVAGKMLNGASATAIPALSSTDADGTISSYVITSVPTVAQGVLSIPCPATPTGATCTGGFADLTPTVLTANPGGIVLTPTQAAGMRFDPAATFTGNITFNYIAFDNNGNLSNVAAYNLPVGSSTTLAVSLLKFTAERNGANIAVNWSVANEVGLSSYDVEYSTNGSLFVNGGTVAAKNLSSSSYHFTLFNFTAPVYYIRLKTIEANGKTNYSHVVTIRLAGEGTNSLSLAPNPVRNVMTVKVGAASDGEAIIRVVNLIGETVYQQNYKLVKGDNTLSVGNMQQAANGSYLLLATVNGEMMSQRFIITK